MNFRGSEQISALRDNGGVMLARRRVDNPQIVPINSNQNDPFLNYGFYSYAIAQPSYGIYVNGGALRVTDAASLGGTWSNLNSDGLVTGPMMITGLPAASEGYVILKYGQLTTQASIGGPILTSPGIDFGDPSTNYSIVEYIAGDDTRGEFPLPEDPARAFGLSYTLEDPGNSNQFFRRVICKFKTNALGVPTAYPVHIGDIQVPIGYIAKVVNFDVFSGG